ncbi:DNA-directed RNA polymerase subunit epsilon [Vaginisenegalia massiliensis]|uniref:DNA-directed RNA polymerase subunit epsilon n=1 Tax=Vaginisenegalia massiliensis TaxID=2058294 RepID=UPI000F52015E|nr:DNA-directed RNA polymerase subunit epsilon [Vaginisenegalia massiliensis]
MIFKITYQESLAQVPLRENTKSMFLEATDKVEARAKFSANTPYNIEFIQEISGAHLQYEREHNADFKVMEF